MAHYLPQLCKLCCFGYVGFGSNQLNNQGAPILRGKCTWDFYFSKDIQTVVSVPRDGKCNGDSRCKRIIKKKIYDAAQG